MGVLKRDAKAAKARSRTRIADQIVLNLPEAWVQSMMKILIPLAMLFIMAGSALGTMWLYTDPTFFQMGTPLQNASLMQANVPNLQIAGAPYFPLLGQGFYKDAIPVRLTNSTNTIQIGIKGPVAMAPVSITFGGHTENNLKYAQSKSSLRIGQTGSWTTLNTPGVS
jgi:hypothetical protein